MLPIDTVLPTDTWSLKFPWVLVTVATVPTSVPLNVVAVIIPEAYMFPSEPIPTPLLNPSWGSLPTWKSLLLLAAVVATPTLPVDLAIETTLNPLSSSWLYWVHEEVGTFCNCEPSPENIVAVIIPEEAEIDIPVPILTSPNVEIPAEKSVFCAVSIPTTLALPRTSRDSVGIVVPIPTCSPRTIKTSSSTCTPALKLKVFLISAIYNDIFSYLF